MNWLMLHRAMRKRYGLITGKRGNDGIIYARTSEYFQLRHLLSVLPLQMASRLQFAPQHSPLAIETFLRCSVAKPFSRPSVELSRNDIASTLSEAGHARSLGKVLPEQTVEILVGSALP